MRAIACSLAAGSRADSPDVAPPLVKPSGSSTAWPSAAGTVAAHDTFVRFAAGVFACLVGCYHPATLDCTVQCSAATDCTGGQACRGGWCVKSGIECDHEGNPVMVDAAPVAPSPDADNTAVLLCQQGCTKGTCDAQGVCVIDCSGTGKCLMDVTCPANLPCRVVCGNGSCMHHVFCSTTTSCEVQCNGTNACGDEIQCPPDHPCDVTCSGTGSCKRRTRCAESCSCDVTCSGPMSCPEPSECPMGCNVGNGCSSLPTSCNRCN